MKVRITCTADFEISEEFIEDGNLTWINDPKKVGHAKPLAQPEPVLDALARLLYRPYFIAGQTPQHITGWNVEARELRR